MMNDEAVCKLCFLSMYQDKKFLNWDVYITWSV